MEDTQIVELFFSRSEEAISETSRKYGSYLRTIAHNVLPDSQDVEEVVNDVYLAAWNSIPPKCPPVLKYYLSRVARNLSFKRVEYLTAEKRCGMQMCFCRNWRNVFRTPAGTWMRRWRQRSLENS